MKYIASIILMLSTFSQPGPGIIAVLVFLFFTASVGWGMYFYVKHINKELEVKVQNIAKELAREKRYNEATKESITVLISTIRALANKQKMHIEVQEQVDAIYKRVEDSLAAENDEDETLR